MKITRLLRGTYEVIEYLEPVSKRGTEGCVFQRKQCDVSK